MPNNINPDDFQQLYQPLHKMLFKTALMFLKSKENAEDALQEAVLLGYKNFSKLRNTEYFKTWITRILINICHDFWKKHNSNVPLDFIVNIISHNNDFTDGIAMLDYINSLDKKSKEVVVLRFWSDLSIDEIAKTLSIPKGTVKSRLSRSLNKLKLELIEEDHS